METPDPTKKFQETLSALRACYYGGFDALATALSSDELHARKMLVALCKQVSEEFAYLVDKSK